MIKYYYYYFPVRFKLFSLHFKSLIEQISMMKKNCNVHAICKVRNEFTVDEPLVVVKTADRTACLKGVTCESANMYYVYIGAIPCVTM